MKYSHKKRTDAQVRSGETSLKLDFSSQKLCDWIRWIQILDWCVKCEKYFLINLFYYEPFLKCIRRYELKCIRVNVLSFSSDFDGMAVKLFLVYIMFMCLKRRKKFSFPTQGRWFLLLGCNFDMLFGICLQRWKVWGFLFFDKP